MNQQQGGNNGASNNQYINNSNLNRAPTQGISRFTIDEFMKYKDILINGSENEKHETITKIRKASSIEDSPPLNLIIKAEIVPILMTFHKEKAPPETVIQDILWTLTNVASGASDDTVYIVKLGGVDYFIEFIQSRSENIYGQALWGLANLAGESANLRDFILDKEVLQMTLNIYYRSKTVMKIETKRTIAWMVNNLCRNKPAVQFNRVRDCLPYLAESLKESDTDILVENLWACAYLSDTGELAAKALMDSEIMSSVANHLMSNIDSLSIVTPALRTCSNIVSGNDNLTERVINLGVVPSVMSLFGSQKPAIRREVCFFFSNVAAGTENQIAFVFQFPNFMGTLRKVISSDEPMIIMEAIWIVANSLMGGNIDHCRRIIDSEIYLDILKAVQALPPKGVNIALDGLRELLNHAMDMNDTPYKLIKLIDMYKNDTITALMKKPDPSINDIIKDIGDLIDDLEQYIDRGDSGGPTAGGKRVGYRDD